MLHVALLISLLKCWTVFQEKITRAEKTQTITISELILM